MPFIEADLNQDYEDKAVPEGRYDLRVTAAEEMVSKNSGADMVRCIVEIVGENGSAPIFHYIVFPIGKKSAAERGVDEDDDNKVRNKMRGITRFLHAFDISFEKKGFNTEDLIGATASDVPVTQDEYEGNVSNSMKLPAAPGQ